jgi:hypothetical protein
LVSNPFTTFIHRFSADHAEPDGTEHQQFNDQLTSLSMFEQTFKNIDDILHKDAGCSSELDYVEPVNTDASTKIVVL